VTTAQKLSANSGRMAKGVNTMRKDGWPTTRAGGPLTNHSNTYIGFRRGDSFLSLTSRDGSWIDGEALARVRDRSKSPISYYDAVLDVQGAPAENSWVPVTYAEVHERNERTDS